MVKRAVKTVSSLQTGEEVSAEFSFLNGVRITNSTISVEDNTASASPNVKVRIGISADSSVSGVMDIEKVPLPEKGKHVMKTTASDNGLIQVGNGTLSVVPASLGTRILVCNADGTLAWIPVEAGVFGVKDGAWHFYQLATCAEAGSDEEE